MLEKGENLLLKKSNDQQLNQNSELKYGELKYGWGKWRPNSLQCLNRPVAFLACICACAFGQGMICTGMSNTFLTSIEKRYGYKSTQIGLFSTFYHVVPALLSTLVCYIGHRHRPFTIALGFITLTMGVLTLTIPQYIVPSYDVGVDRHQDTCRYNPANKTLQSSSCDEVVPHNWIYMIIFICGYALMGLGVSPLYSLGFAHLDEITNRGQNSLYLGIMATFAVFGPAAGFMAGNPILKVFVDIKQVMNLVLKKFKREIFLDLCKHQKPRNKLKHTFRRAKFYSTFCFSRPDGGA